MLALSGLLVLRALGFWPGDAIVWPLLAAAAGALLIWRQSGELASPARRQAPIDALREERPVVEAVAEPEAPAAAPAADAGAVAWRGDGVAGGRTGRRAVAIGGRAMSRIGAGAALIVGAGLLFLWTNGALNRVGNAVLPVIVVLVALVLILAPLWWRLLRGLRAERSERLRSQERTALAAHLHDSVLQTLALIQRRTQDPREVAALARRQERELRDWLAQRSPAAAGTSIARALEDAAAEIEVARGALVEVVVVGERVLDEAGEAAVAAAREAILNAAKFAAGSPISVYAELAPAQIQIFIRDRGAGFDPSRVPPDRRGLRDSIVGRMERYGGHATVRSTPGQGTEIELSLRRSEEA
jgi:signal transduction histidine kinase